MIYDEKTTEIEIPIKLHGQTSQISIKTIVPPVQEVRTHAPMVAGVPTQNFVEDTARTHSRSLVRQAIVAGLNRRKASLEWIRAMDVTEPWLLRLIAVLTILLLSILIL